MSNQKGDAGQCPVCKSEMFQRSIRYDTSRGKVCSTVCRDYLKENESRLNEGVDDLNEVRLML